MGITDRYSNFNNEHPDAHPYIVRIAQWATSSYFVGSGTEHRMRWNVHINAMNKEEAIQNARKDIPYNGVSVEGVWIVV